jgi:hypothetical protein
MTIGFDAGRLPLLETFSRYGKERVKERRYAAVKFAAVQPLFVGAGAFVLIGVQRDDICHA